MGIAKKMSAPLLGILLFLLFWSAAAQRIDTSLGEFPRPIAVLTQMSALYQEHRTERQKERAFYARQEIRNAQRAERDPNYQVKIRPYTGKETFIDQMGTSLLTVACGFLIGMVIAVPLGVLVGLSSLLNAACNPVIQMLKPVSPLAWLPLVTMVVSALYVTPDPVVPKAFLISMVTVTMCSLWPMLINTSVGVASVDQDLLNVSRVLRMGTLKHIRKIVLPASVPMIFTGMRLSLGVAWMVLIAAEMLSQNPGLGKFVWDEFQNGSSDSLSRIMVAVLVIGLIGFLLDRGMLLLQRWLSWDKAAAVR